MRDPGTESVQAFNDLLTAPQTTPWYINVVAPDLESARALAERMRELDEVARAITAADLIPAANAAGYKEIDVSGGGSITGTVAAGSATAETKTFTISKDP